MTETETERQKEREHNHTYALMGSNLKREEFFKNTKNTSMIPLEHNQKLYSNSHGLAIGSVRLCIILHKVQTVNVTKT